MALKSNGIRQLGSGKDSLSETTTSLPLGQQLAAQSGIMAWLGQPEVMTVALLHAVCTHYTLMPPFLSQGAGKMEKYNWMTPAQ